MLGLEENEKKLQTTEMKMLGMICGKRENMASVLQ